MKFALLRCCTTPLLLEQYESSTNAILEVLGIEVYGDTEFNCCGYPLRNFNPKAYILASARNLALAERRGLNMLTVCNCCFGSLKHAQHMMGKDSNLTRDINGSLATEGLAYNGSVEARHLLQVLYEDVGLEKIRGMLRYRFEGLRVATHYGCHLLRPKDVVGFDDPFVPGKFDQLVEITGAESIPWRSKLECCGSPLLGTNSELSMDLTAKKLTNARESGADFLCVACPYCQLQLDRVQAMMMSQRNVVERVPSLLYPQLLGLCLGIDEQKLGFQKNILAAGDMTRYLRENTSPSAAVSKCGERHDRRAAT